jgi:hypothetical protein
MLCAARRPGKGPSRCERGCGILAPRVSELSKIGHPWIDESRAPLYLWSFPESFTDETLVEACAMRERWAAVAKYRVAWVVDLANLGGVTATQRKIFADHLKRFEPHDLKWNQGSAIVAKSTLVRGVVTAVFWLQAPRFPNHTFADRTSAILWARARLSDGAPSS